MTLAPAVDPGRAGCWRPGCGRGGTTPSWPGSAAGWRSAPVTFDTRQWNRQAAAAEGRAKAPGSVPLLARGAKIPVGGTIRAIACKWKPVFAVPAAACARHMVIIGASGSGKTNLMMRLWAGWYTAALDAY